MLTVLAARWKHSVPLSMTPPPLFNSKLSVHGMWRCSAPLRPCQANMHLRG